jgi:hypothetical protein
VIAAVPKPDSGIRCKLDSDVADKALHAASVVQCVCSCQKFFYVVGVQWRSDAFVTGPMLAW